MPLQKILFKPGVNKENTRYTTEGGWYECDKIRFRQGNPEVIGGWQRISSSTFLGVCRSLWNWVTLGNLNLIGVGTNLKFYIESGGGYNDVTPIRATATLTNPFTATLGSAVITVADVAHGCGTGDFVTFSGATGLGGNITAGILNQEYQVTVIDVDSYTITVGANANATDVSGSPGGGTVTAAYQLNVGPQIQIPLVGWGAGGWGFGGWGAGVSNTIGLQLWNQINYGEDLIFGPRGGGIYYWDATGASALTTRGVNLNTLGGTVSFTNSAVTGVPTLVTSTVLFTEGAAIQFSGGSLPTGITAATTYYVFQVNGLTFNLLDSAGAEISTTSTGTGSVSLIVDVPTTVNSFTVSDSSRFIIAFGCNDYGSATIDPMLIRWSGQDDPYNWTPDPTNQAGFTRLSHGSEIITTVQTRQEIVVFTDSSVYSLQYLGPPYVWAPQLLGDNISIISPNCVVQASGIVYWMGVDKFYVYDGRVNTLNCDLRRYIFQDINLDQEAQVFAGTNEGFNEIWWFYCSADSTTVDRYAVYNYQEKVWYYGTMARTAWLDSGLQPSPLAATYSYNLVSQEQGLDDKETATTVALNAYISSSEFDIGDGHNFGLVTRIIPDVTFDGSTVNNPSLDFAVRPRQFPGTNYGTADSPTVTSADNYQNQRYYTVQQFTQQVFVRVRGRQMAFRVTSNDLGVAWQLGVPRIDTRPDGRR